MCLTDVITLFAERYPGTLFQDFMRYVLGAGGVFLVINLMLANRLASRKVRAKTPPPVQIVREVMTSLRTVLIFAIVGTSVGLGVEAGLIPVYFDIEDYGVAWLIASSALLIILHDAWFYWSHVIMHRPRLFRWFHRTHHRSHNPTPFTSYSFDATEALVNAIYFPLALAIIPAHPIALLIFTSHMMLRNAIGHCGYEIFPSRADGRPAWDWLTTVTHHDLHHAQAGWNFGLYFTFWDRMMGTEHPAYHAEFAKAVGKDALADWSEA